MKTRLVAAMVLLVGGIGMVEPLLACGEKFLMPVELPAEFAYLLDDPKEAMRFLLEDQFDAFWKHRPSKQDIVDLIGWIAKTAGLAVGESSASGGSSPKGSSPSRPTSPATTRPTSAKRASGRGQ